MFKLDHLKSKLYSFECVVECFVRVLIFHVPFLPWILNLLMVFKVQAMFGLSHVRFRIASTKCI